MTSITSILAGSPRWSIDMHCSTIFDGHDTPSNKLFPHHNIQFKSKSSQILYHVDRFFDMILVHASHSERVVRLFFCSLILQQ